MQKKAQEAIGQFCDDLMTHTVLPAKMTGPLGSYKVDGDEYEFFVIAKVKVSNHV